MLLDGLSPSFSQKNNEDQVRSFIRQLLLALKCLHDKKIAHLDLRPEVLLLRDDRLLLADFGQSRRLHKGKIIANITGSPEFVSPEIAAGIPVTLASDMWSIGALTYVLLSGISPFLGDNDQETVRNVLLGNYSLGRKELADVSDLAKTFISQLLTVNIRNRMTVDDALLHPWISAPCSSVTSVTPSLTPDAVKEFKYRHKWLVRFLSGNCYLDEQQKLVDRRGGR
ncbi:unnamed protein product [Enterobius vermicularis]|uniref:Protein kinase domain-containing protein n=1 Tax=Enterobius vermicularis TaxID=51028 RepID=A0A0N4VLL0_ENTVE|nr:unnamed protein product [Enterobius vermicularis]